MNALRHRVTLAAEPADVMKTVDVLITPGWQGPAIRFEDTAVVNPPDYTMPFNVTGSPALTIGNGLSSAGQPLSLQVAGRPLEYALMLKVGDEFEKATRHRMTRPAFATA